jgi:hypothetical protein
VESDTSTRASTIIELAHVVPRPETIEVGSGTGIAIKPPVIVTLRLVELLIERDG